MEQLTKARPRVANPIKNQAEPTKRAQEAKAEGVRLGLLPKDIAPMSREALSKIPNADMIDYMRQHYIKQGLPADEVRRLTLANGARELFQRYGKKYSEASIRGQLANTLDQQHQKNPDLFGTNRHKEAPKAEPAVIRAPEQAQPPVVSYHEKVQSALAHPDKVYGRRLYEQASREHYFKKHRDELETLSEEDPDKYVELMTKITSKIKDHANKFFPVEAAEPVKTPTETSDLRVDKDYVKPKPRVRSNKKEDDSPEAREERHMARVASLVQTTPATPKPEAVKKQPAPVTQPKVKEIPVPKEPTPAETQALVDRQKRREEYEARQAAEASKNEQRTPKKVVVASDSTVKNIKLPEATSPAVDLSYTTHPSFRFFSNNVHKDPAKFARTSLGSKHFGWMLEPGNLDKFTKHHGYDSNWTDSFHSTLEKLTS